MNRVFMLCSIALAAMFIMASAVSAHNGPPGPVIPPDANHADHPARPCNGENSGPYRSEECPPNPVVCPPGTVPQDGMQQMHDDSKKDKDDDDDDDKPKVIVIICVPVAQPPVVTPPVTTPPAAAPTPAAPVAAPAPAAVPAASGVQGVVETSRSPSRARINAGASCASRTMRLTVRGAAAVRRVSVSINGHRVALSHPNRRTVNLTIRRRGSGVQHVVVRVTIGGRVQTIRRTARASCAAVQTPAPQFTG